MLVPSRIAALLDRVGRRVVSVAVIATMTTAALPVAADPPPSDEGDESIAQNGAVLTALASDPWFASDQDLVTLRADVAANVGEQTLAFVRAEAARAVAQEAFEVAQADRGAAEAERDRRRELVFALAIGSYTTTDQAGILADTWTQSEFVRREALLEAATEQFLDDLDRAEASLALAVEAEDDATRRLLVAEAESDRRTRYLGQASQAVADYSGYVQARTELIEERTSVTLLAFAAPYELVEVEGFVVNRELAEPLQALLIAAREDGIFFGGWGWRTREEQIDLRRSHCGTSGHAIFDAPSSSCTPPTAIPGESEHELGLAVDFTENGSTLTRGSAGFAWLSEHAADYGLINLPSEAWHWSTTGG